MTQEPKDILSRDWYEPMPCDWLAHAARMLEEHDARMGRTPMMFNLDPELT